MGAGTVPSRNRFITDCFSSGISSERCLQGSAQQIKSKIDSEILAGWENSYLDMGTGGEL